ncbi:MAG: regulatory protein RecX [Clostridia bacterium]|nr:regulatory protein RecX [Clostridia bacterium]
MTIEIKKLTSLYGGIAVGVDIEIKQGGEKEAVCFKILTSHYANMKLLKGEITPEDYENIENASKLCKAYLMGMNILSFGANTERTLVLKLRRRGIEPDIAEEAAKMLASNGYIDENEDIGRDIERCLRKGWGSGRIMAFLHQKGYEDEALAAAEDSLSETDFGEACYDLLCRRCDELPSEQGETRKLIASLTRYGYSMSEIRYAMAKFENG